MLIFSAYYMTNAPLGTGTLGQGGLEPHTEAEQPCLCDHYAVVDAESGNSERAKHVRLDTEEGYNDSREHCIPLIRREDIPTTLSRHDAHHFLETFITYTWGHRLRSAQGPTQAVAVVIRFEEALTSYTADD